MESKVSRSLAHFAAKFCNELGTSKTSVCSPLSAESVLALLALGCRGQARAELLQALDLPDDDAIRSSFRQLTSTLKSIKGATLSMANKIYLQKGATLKPVIEKDAEEVFRSALEQLDFNERENAAEIVNKWVRHCSNNFKSLMNLSESQKYVNASHVYDNKVAQQTNNLIKDVVSADTFQEGTCMLLINAIYFRGEWLIPFEKRMTKNRDFYINKDTTIKVPQMYMSYIDYDYGCSKQLKAQFLRIPYKGGEAIMVIVLPDEIEGLSGMLKQLAEGYDLMTDLETMKNTMLDIMIPKFKAEITINLKEVLPKLGIKSIFDAETSDIDMLTSKKRLFVSEAIQKAFIEVDEVGTEAAACTMGHEMECCLRRTTRFIANRPFLYLLACHKIPIFIGIYEGSEYA